MSAALLVRYGGFEVKLLAREYKFQIREAQDEPRDFTLTIANAAFDSHQVRYQDAPDVCSLKLQKELAATANHPAESHFQVSEDDLENYRAAHTRKTTRYPKQHKTEHQY